MIGTATISKVGSHYIVLKTTRHKKAHVSICLNAKAGRTKLKLFIVYKGTKSKVLTLNPDFSGKDIIALSENGWMNTPITLDGVQKVLELFSFHQRLLLWDSYECHIEEFVSKDLKAKTIKSFIVPGDCTKCIQAPDVSWKKPFKAKLANEYDEWLSTIGINCVTDSGNLKSPEWGVIVQ